jgi:hypothetical protein
MQVVSLRVHTVLSHIRVHFLSGLRTAYAKRGFHLTVARRRLRRFVTVTLDRTCRPRLDAIINPYAREKLLRSRIELFHTSDSGLFVTPPVRPSHDDDWFVSSR